MIVCQQSGAASNRRMAGFGIFRSEVPLPYSSSNEATTCCTSSLHSTNFVIPPVAPRAARDDRPVPDRTDPTRLPAPPPLPEAVASLTAAIRAAPGLYLLSSVILILLQR
eukprot:6214566-Pleurochrysis_carterae.AAC.8